MLHRNLQYIQLDRCSSPWKQLLTKQSQFKVHFLAFDRITHSPHRQIKFA